MLVRSLTALVIYMLAIPCQASLLLTATPTLSVEKAHDIYKPVAALLTDALGIPVEFGYTENWQEFSYKVLANEYDMILAQPHIAAYVSSPDSNLFMDVPVRLDQNTRFHVVVDESSAAEKLKDLSYSRICMRPSPNFSGVIIKREFSNPVIQPVVIEVNGGFDEVYQRFKRKRCQAAVINDDTYQRLNTAGEAIRSIYTTPDSPNLALAVSTRIPPPDMEIISNALKNAGNIEKLSPLFKHHANKKALFVSTRQKELEPFNILPGVVWGW